MSDRRRILVTSALPYANGSIHIGHLVEYIQTDIWVRFQKFMGHDCHYMCADDTHGTPIMLSARKQGITPEQLIERMHREHSEDFARFHVAFDNYYTTNSEENRQFAELIYSRLREKGHIVDQVIEQSYCPKDQMFLPDRLIRGTCPKCGAADQYGDACESCSATYRPTDLKDARCAECGTAPETRSSTHYFFRLADFEDRLRDWVSRGLVQAEIANKLDEWFKEGLRDWDISRDAPYFGFRIPGTDDKYFYVWLDAPIGYMASTKNWAGRVGRTFEEFWLDPQSEIVHFIGKDIAYFHTLFFPAMLMGADFLPPTRVYVHGFLTVNGTKMSKSRGTFISARRYLEHLDPEYLRYYYACKLGPGVDDIDLNLQDFVARVNADVGNQFVNLGSRVIAFLHKKLDGRLGGLDADGEALVKSIEDAAAEIAALYDGRDFSTAMKRILAMAHEANQFVANRAPWADAGKDPERARATCTAAVNAFAKLNVMLTPVCPVLCARVEKILGRGPTTFASVRDRLLDRGLNPFENIFTKVAEENVQKMVEAAAEAPAPSVPPAEAIKVEPLEPTIAFDEFAKVDLRVARVVEAKVVEGADKLLQLTIDLGPLGQRNIFAGIRKSHDPASLVGSHIIVVANLAPRKMKFGLSEGMLLACGPGDKTLFLATTQPGAKPGERLH